MAAKAECCKTPNIQEEDCGTQDVLVRMLIDHDVHSQFPQMSKNVIVTFGSISYQAFLVLFTNIHQMVKI